ncbi:hypothetical protein ACF958_004117 [Providencia rettgeri]
MTVTLQGFQQNKSELPVTNGYRQWRFACLSGLDSRVQLPEQA